jgi:RNA polymerase sigma factor (sigma-70 family)
MIICLTEVAGVVEQEHAQAVGIIPGDSLDEVARHRTYLADIYDSLPGYGSKAFWRIVEEPDLRSTLPLEVLVKCVRAAIAYGDNEGRNRIVTVIIRRTQASNEYWTQNVLNALPLSAEERSVLFNDLYADLCEHLIRALIDPTHLFWEEHFQHCLRFERKHAYHTFMVREGRWHYHPDKRPERVPRTLIASLDQAVVNAEGEMVELSVSDEQAQQALLAVEHADLPLFVLHLPEKLKTVVWLMFWEGRTEKDTARILGITDRTVRNRLHEALKLLREKPGMEKGAWL